MKAEIKKIPLKFLRLLIISHLHEVPFIVFVSFLTTFVVTRTYIFFTHHDILSAIFSVERITINGIHIHHLTWGIIIMSISGFLSLINKSPYVHRRLALIYGVGLGLIFDEFAMWLHLEDNYYSSLTYNSIVTISLVLLSAIYFPGFWRRMKNHFIKIYKKY